MTIFKNITKKAYLNLLDNKMTRPNTFYYTTDTKEVFLGDKESKRLVIVKDEFPDTGDAAIDLSKIYYKPSTCEARVYHEKKYINILEKPIIQEQSSNEYVTVSEMINYIKNTGSSGGGSGSSGLKIIQVDELPTEDIDTTAIYAVPVDNGGESKFNEYAYINYEWELVGEDTKAILDKELTKLGWQK